MIALALLRRYWQIALIVTLAGALMLACHARDAALKEQGRAEQRMIALETKYQHDSARAYARDTVVRSDTIRLVRWLTRYDTVRSTLNIRDTIAVKEYVTVTDSAVRNCRESVSALALSCAAKDTVIATLRAMRAASTVTVTRPPSWSERLLWAAAGAALDEGARFAIRSARH